MEQVSETEQPHVRISTLAMAKGVRFSNARDARITSDFNSHGVQFWDKNIRGHKGLIIYVFFRVK